jgi:hypothetical protein
MMLYVSDLNDFAVFQGFNVFGRLCEMLNFFFWLSVGEAKKVEAGEGMKLARFCGKMALKLSSELDVTAADVSMTFTIFGD